MVSMSQRIQEKEFQTKLPYPTHNTRAQHEKRELWRQDERACTERFKRAAFEELNLDWGSSAGEEAYRLAWEYGHSCGLHEVWQKFEDLVVIIHKAIDNYTDQTAKTYGEIVEDLVVKLDRLGPMSAFVIEVALVKLVEIDHPRILVDGELITNTPGMRRRRAELDKTLCKFYEDNSETHYEEDVDAGMPLAVVDNTETEEELVKVGELQIGEKFQIRNVEFLIVESMRGWLLELKFSRATNTLAMNTGTYELKVFKSDIEVERV